MFYSRQWRTGVRVSAMFVSSNKSASVFARSELRVLRRAYELAIQAVEQAGLSDPELADDVAKLMFGLARDMRSTGRELSAPNAAELLASQANATLLAVQAFSLCA